jgi:hypothetical protein
MAVSLGAAERNETEHLISRDLGHRRRRRVAAQLVEHLGAVSDAT